MIPEVFHPIIVPLKGTGFTGCGKTLMEPGFVSGHDFSRAVSAVKSTGPLGPEECFSSKYAEFSLFPQPVLAPEGMLASPRNLLRPSLNLLRPSLNRA
jgi:hypothetical protein